MLNKKGNFDRETERRVNTGYSAIHNGLLGHLPASFELVEV
jgi:hypothetical protein